VLRRIHTILTHNWLLKITALGLAFLLWSVVKADNRVSIENVPIQVVNRDGDWVLSRSPEPPAVSVAFSGPVRELIRVATERPDVLVPIDDVTDSVEIVLLRTNWVQLYPGMNNTRVEDIRPTQIRLTFDRVTSRMIPLSVQLTGSPVQGFAVAGQPQIEPGLVNVSGAAARIAELRSLRLPSIDVSTLSTTDTVILAVDTTGLGIVVSPRQVRVIVPIGPAPDSVPASLDEPGDSARPGRRGRGN
jgi:YbbR domain-containing protein